MFRRSNLLALAAVAASAVLGIGVAGANVVTQTPLIGLGHVVADAHGHVFLTSDSQDPIVVLHANGTADTTITNELGSSAMALSADGSTLYVVRNDAQIDEIDTTTLTDLGHFPANVANDSIALANGRLWYADSAGDLTSVTLDGSHTVTPTSTYIGGALVASSPGLATGVVIAGANIMLADVSDPSNVTTTTSAVSTPGITSLTVAPNGQSVLAALTASNEVVTLTLPGLTAATTYGIGGPSAIAVSPSGSRLAVGRFNGNDVDVSLFNIGNPTVINARVVSQYANANWQNFIGFSSNSAFIYAVTPSAQASTVFNALQTIPLTSAQWKVTTSKAAITVGGAVTVSLHLGLATTNRTVRVYRQSLTMTNPVLLATGKVGTSGNYSFVTHPGQDMLYTVRWGGDATHLPMVSGAHLVNVHLLVHRATLGGYATSSGVRLYHYTGGCYNVDAGCPTFQSWTTPLQPRRTMSFVAQEKTRKGAWVTIAKGGFATGSGGKLILSDRYRGVTWIGVNQRIRFSMTKSATLLGNTSTWVLFRVTK